MIVESVGAARVDPPESGGPGQGEEQSERVRAALVERAPRDREVVVMRHLEQMETPEIAAAPGIGAGAVRNRQFRALVRLRALLEGDEP
jgi:RNA polymerase sigma factor (sigma-70 family)